MKNNQAVFLFMLFLIVGGGPLSAIAYELPSQVQLEYQDHNWLIHSRIGEVIFEQNNKMNTLILAENRITSRSNRRRCRGNNGYYGRNYGYRKGYRDGFGDGYRGRNYRNYRDYRYDRWGGYSGSRDIYGERYYGEEDDYRYNRRGNSSPYHRGKYPSIYDRR